MNAPNSSLGEHLLKIFIHFVGQVGPLTHQESLLIAFETQELISLITPPKQHKNPLI